MSDGTAYDRLAKDYDVLTDAAGRRPGTGRFVDLLLARSPARNVLDVACGNGLFTLELARRGRRVSGFDLAPGMVEQARTQAAREGLEVEFATAPMERPGDVFPGPFDTVLCMGNSLPHLLTVTDLRAACAAFAERLAPGGIVAVALLNYPKLLAEGERIVGISREGAEEFIRFYDIGPDLLTFNILRVWWDAAGTARHALESMPMRPWAPKDIADALACAGLAETAFHGGLDFRPFDAGTSDTVLITARKPAAG